MKSILSALSMSFAVKRCLATILSRGVFCGAFSIFYVHGAIAEEYSLDDAKIELVDGVLTMANARIERRFDWDGGNLAGIEIADPVSGRHWPLAATAPDIAPFGAPLVAKKGKLKVRRVAATSIRPAHLEAQIRFTAGALEVRRICRVFPDTPAIGCSLALRGRTAAERTASGDRAAMIETAATKSSDGDSVLDRLMLPASHWRLEAVRFRVATDHNDWLTTVEPGELYRRDQRIAANILRLEDRMRGGQIFIVKEAPIGADQLAYPGYDFILRNGDVRVVGSGLSAEDLDPKKWRMGYSVTIGVAGSGEAAALLALREHREALRIYRPERDAMILMNTWGDRNKDARMSEAFVLRELEAASRLGLTHMQLDDGWQAGLSKNSAQKAGEMWDDWNAESWRAHPERFPRGLAPVIQHAKELGIEIGLWFNPSRANSYAKWRRDADILIDLYRTHGVRIFKIDGIEIPDWQAEENLGRMFTAVAEATGGEVVFNIDVTAGRRFGYFHPLNAYGNIFVENRYTDWGSYYPYRTLRNLWQLARYTPPQFLQMEFLNVWRNADQYPPGDPFAPARVPFDYAFATTMMAQPLAWFEATSLPPEAAAIAPLIARYKSVAADIHAGRILPIGERPDGENWTGFQSIGNDGLNGYLLIFREANDQAETMLQTWLPATRRVHFTPVLGAGEAFTTDITANGAIRVHLNAPHSFALYRYVIEGD